MDNIFEEVRNSCGHRARYILIPNETGIDVKSECEDGCEICREESEDYRRQIELKIEFFFGDWLGEI